MNTKSKPILLKGLRIYSEEQWIENGYIKINDQQIVEVGPMEKLTFEEEWETLDFPSTSYKAVPGFIDVHIHGAN